MIEIPDGLVGMNDHGERDFIGHGAFDAGKPAIFQT
jgi:hypothetical protein